MLTANIIDKNLKILYTALLLVRLVLSVCVCVHTYIYEENIYDIYLCYTVYLTCIYIYTVYIDIDMCERGKSHFEHSLKHSFHLDWCGTRPKPHGCRSTHCLCTQSKAGSVCLRTQYWSAVSKMKFKKERTRQKILTPCGDRRYSSSQHQREGGLSCSAWWAERLEAAWNSGVFFPPINKPPKNKQFHPTEKEMGRWDKREGQTGVRKEWYLWQRPLREKLEEMRAEDEGVFMKGAPDLLSPSCWPADVVWILGQDFIFWSPRYLMNCIVDTVTIS